MIFDEVDSLANVVVKSFLLVMLIKREEVEECLLVALVGLAVPLEIGPHPRIFKGAASALVTKLLNQLAGYPMYR